MPALKARASRAAVLIPAALALVPATADADSLRMTAKEVSLFRAVNAHTRSKWSHAADFAGT